MNGLLIIERIVLESLEKREKVLSDLVLDTKLDHNLVKNIVYHLINRGIVKIESGGIYSLNQS